MASDLLNPNGTLRFKFIRELNKGECCCNFDNDDRYITDGNKLYMYAYHWEKQENSDVN